MPIAASAPSYCSTSLPHRPHASTRNRASSAPIAELETLPSPSRCASTSTIALVECHSGSLTLHLLNAARSCYDNASAERGLRAALTWLQLLQCGALAKV